MRMIKKNLCVQRPSFEHAIYSMSAHKPSKVNPDRVSLLYESVKRMDYDGLNNLDKVGVEIMNVEFYALYTHLSINVGKPKSPKK